MQLDDEFKKLIAFCRKNGVQTYKKAGDSVEISLHPSALFPESEYRKKKKEGTSSDDIKVEDAFSPEDALYWSSAGIPEPQEAQ